MLHSNEFGWYYVVHSNFPTNVTQLACYYYYYYYYYKHNIYIFTSQYILLLRTAFANPKCSAIYIQYIKSYLYLFQILRSTLIHNMQVYYSLRLPVMLFYLIYKNTLRFLKSTIRVQLINLLLFYLVICM